MNAVEAGPSTASLLLAPAAHQDIEAIVRLHREALPYSLNSKLGDSHLARLYAIMLSDSPSMVAIARRQGVLAGVVSASLDPGQLAARAMAGLKLRDWAELLGRVAARPGLLADWLENVRLSRPVTLNGAVVRPCLTAIAVAAGQRRGGVGRALVGAVDEFFGRHACPAYYLDTRVDNAISRVFYARLGFAEAERRGRAMILVKELTRGGPAG